ncbi:MAG: glutamine synthetase family protein [Hyphomicrobiales bacterium]
MSGFMSGVLGRLGLLTAECDERAATFLERVGEDNIETIRFAFSDQHGVLRSKAIAVDAVASALRNGITVPSSLILKDTSGRTAFSIWEKDAGFGDGAFAGAADMLLVPDVESYCNLPWSSHSAWVLCDVVQASGAAIPFAPRTVLRNALDQMHAKGFDLICGLEVEFHIFRIVETNLTHENGGMPGTPPQTAPLNHGYQLLNDAAYAASEHILDQLRRTAQEMGLSVRSVEVEFGASQFEFTFAPAPAWDHANNMVKFRAMVKQVCARAGYHSTFMCRPTNENSVSSGWHLHQSLVDRKTGENLFIPRGEDLTVHARQWIAGLLTHAGESCLMTTPTVNGYRRFQPHQLAPDRIQWGHDNRGAMVRAIAAPEDEASRIENRAGEPAATPHYYIASQILSGLSGIENKLHPPEPVDMPYDCDAEALPQDLGAAIEAFAAGTLYRTKLGDQFADYLANLKQQEWARYQSEPGGWENREYIDFF